ncbi:MAG: hypothetical protein IT431_13360 [Phycisphaerales bacterium]|nr:hypothetical protein [Phycisphaerales bacterium]
MNEPRAGNGHDAGARVEHGGLATESLADGLAWVSPGPGGVSVVVGGIGTVAKDGMLF